MKRGNQAQTVGRVINQSVRLLLPYLSCFNVEDVVNIHGHFSLSKISP